MTDKACWRCVYFCSDYNECKKNPPQTGICDRTGRHRIYPMTCSGDWCDEFVKDPDKSPSYIEEEMPEETC